MIDMPVYMLMRVKVRNFFEWKKTYDSQLMKRIEAGLIEKYIFRDSDDTNAITVLYRTKDPARARAFAESPELRERMEKGGVVGRPEIHFLDSYSEALARASGF